MRHCTRTPKFNAAVTEFQRAYENLMREIENIDNEPLASPASNPVVETFDKTQPQLIRVPEDSPYLYITLEEEEYLVFKNPYSSMPASEFLDQVTSDLIKEFGCALNVSHRTTIEQGTSFTTEPASVTGWYEIAVVGSETRTFETPREEGGVKVEDYNLIKLPPRK